MAEFASNDTGACSIASFYKYTVAKYSFYIYLSLKLCTIVCRFDLDFILLLYRVRVAVPFLFGRTVLLSTCFPPAPRVLQQLETF